jgi:hypothetical protein
MRHNPHTLAHNIEDNERVRRKEEERKSIGDDVERKCIGDDVKNVLCSLS